MKGRFWMLEEGALRPFEVELSGGRLERRPSLDASGYLVPGFVDIHIHGAFGIDFMSASLEQMIELADRLGDCGCEFFFPTTVSASAESVRAALSNLPSDARMPGFHLEGPFISPKFPGAQPPKAIVPAPPFKEEIEGPWREILKHSKLKLVTLAPELPRAPELVRNLSTRGVRVSMGHTNATYAEARIGFENGVRHATHTFNAMRGLHHREPGALGFVLDEPQVRAELIYDRLHVSREAASILLKCKGDDGVIAVSDGTMASGMADGTKLEMWGHEVEVRAGGVYLKGADTLAGSAITLLDAFRNLAQDFGPEAAIKLCCINPRRAMGLEGEPKIWLELNGGFELWRVHKTTR